MILNQKLLILFEIHKTKINKQGLAPIWARITVDGKRAEISTGKQIDLEKWDVKTGRATGIDPDSQLMLVG